MQFRKDIASLEELKVGERGEIAYLKRNSGRRVQKLLSLGLVPGKTLVLKRKVPNYLVQVGFTQIALERGLGNSVLVYKRKASVP